MHAFPHVPADRPLVRFGVRLARLAGRLAIYFPAYFLLREHVCSLERVSGRSMVPTFCPPPPPPSSLQLATAMDYVLAKRWNAARDIRRGQVVMFRFFAPFPLLPQQSAAANEAARSPVDPERAVVKRVVGLEGDIVHTRPDSKQQQLVVVPRGQLWVEGDGALHSLDSNSYGPIPVSLVAARVTHIVFPPARMGAVSQAEGLVRRGALVRRAEEPAG